MQIWWEAHESQGPEITTGELPMKPTQSAPDDCERSSAMLSASVERTRVRNATPNTLNSPRLAVTSPSVNNEESFSGTNEPSISTDAWICQSSTLIEPLLPLTSRTSISKTRSATVLAMLWSFNGNNPNPNATDALAHAGSLGCVGCGVAVCAVCDVVELEQGHHNNESALFPLGQFIPFFWQIKSPSQNVQPKAISYRHSSHENFEHSASVHFGTQHSWLEGQKFRNETWVFVLHWEEALQLALFPYFSEQVVWAKLTNGYNTMIKMK